MHLPSVELVPAIKYLVCWPMASWLRQGCLIEKPSGLPQQISSSPLNLFRGGRVSPRRHLRNLVASRTSNHRALRVMWAWLQGAKRGLPQIPDEFILLSKTKHAKALQKVLPEIPKEFLEEFKNGLKELWRGVDRISVRRFRDAEGNLKTGLIRQWTSGSRISQSRRGKAILVGMLVQHPHDQTEENHKRCVSGSVKRFAKSTNPLWMPCQIDLSLFFLRCL